MCATKRTSRELPSESTQILGRPLGTPSREPEVAPEFEPFYRRLIELRDGLQDRLRSLHESAHESAPSDFQEIGDAATETFDRDYNLAMMTTYQEQLYEVEEALRRLVQGRYGVCELTGKPISKKRLKAVPWTRFSREAEAQLEESGTPPLRFELPPRLSSAPQSASDDDPIEEGEEKD